MKPKLIIFDFDGVLADTKKIWIKCIIKVLKEEKFYCPKCVTDIIIPFGRKIQDVLKLLDIPKSRIEEIRTKVHKLVLKHKIKIQNIEPLKTIKIKKIILSNSPAFVVRHALKNKLKIFDRVYGSDDFSDKASFIESLMKKQKFRKKDLWYVGDIGQDIRVARKGGCTSVILASKFAWNPLKEVLKERPDIVIKDFYDLKKIMNN
ncbi:MAG: HAD hydrolase-like protein [Candidatus Pacearchaeota archaeon]